MTSPAFDWPHQLPPNAVHVGAALDDMTWAGPEHPLPPGDEPFVLAGFSTAPTRGQLGLVQRVVAALDACDVRAVVTTGPAVDPADVPSARPDRVHVVTAAPHTDLLRSASAVITHCGHGTATKAVAAGVPVLCLPLGRDQHDVARRVTERGAGLRLRHTSPAPDIARVLRRLLCDESFAQSAHALARAMANDGTDGRAVAELEALPSRSPSAGPAGRGVSRTS
jgi:UDP:flavonoid glycosyltransferase YjiC (YdhE family)